MTARRLPLFAATLASLLAFSAATSAQAERRVALVLGADDYRSIRPLENAANDAQAIEAALEELGFEVFLETNRDLRRMRRALDDFREDGADADVALVFFAGHGVEIAGENRLLPVDANAESLEALKESSLPLEEVREAVASVAKIGLVVLDACRNDPFVGLGGDGRSAVALKAEVAEAVKAGFGRIGRADNMLFAFAAAPGMTAGDGVAGGNSPFTSALVKYLGTEGVDIRSALTLVQQEVYDRSRGGQLPYVESGLPRLFFAAAATEDLPERERLLLAMANVTPDVRGLVEQIAAQYEMPLAPLFGTLLSQPTGQTAAATLREAAERYVFMREQIRLLASSDPDVSRHRQAAEDAVSLGAFEQAANEIEAAMQIDRSSIETLKSNTAERQLSYAASVVLLGGIRQSQSSYREAYDAYQMAVEAYGDVETAYFSAEDHARLWAAQSNIAHVVMMGALEDVQAELDGLEVTLLKRWVELEPGSAEHAERLRVAEASLAEKNGGRVAPGFSQTEVNVAKDASARALSIARQQADRARGDLDWQTRLVWSLTLAARFALDPGPVADEAASVVRGLMAGGRLEPARADALGMFVANDTLPMWRDILGRFQ